jgi:hypothetical protein
MTVKRITSPMTRNQRKKSGEGPSEVKIRKIVRKFHGMRQRGESCCRTSREWVVPVCLRNRGISRTTGS